VAVKGNCPIYVHNYPKCRLTKNKSRAQPARHGVGTIVDSVNATLGSRSSRRRGEMAKQDTTMQASRNPNERPEDRPT
jgi:hypothetical protein